MICADIPEMVTIREASRRTGLSYDCLRKWCLKGIIVHIRIGNGKFLINFGRLVEFLNTSYGRTMSDQQRSFPPPSYCKHPEKANCRGCEYSVNPEAYDPGCILQQGRTEDNNV